MEKLDKVIAGLTECSRGRERNCYECLYWDYHDYECVQALRRDALDVIEALRAERDDLRKDIEVLTEELRNSEPVVHAHWVDRPDGAYRICSNCRSGIPTMQRPLAWLRCPVCGAHMDEQLEVRTCYCPICDKHFQVRSNDSMGDCPDCGHHVVLHKEESE